MGNPIQAAAAWADLAYAAVKAAQAAGTPKGAEVASRIARDAAVGAKASAAAAPGSIVAEAHASAAAAYAVFAADAAAAAREGRHIS